LGLNGALLVRRKKPPAQLREVRDVPHVLYVYSDVGAPHDGDQHRFLGLAEVEADVAARRSWGEQGLAEAVAAPRRLISTR
jgi:hypothetical protein